MIYALTYLTTHDDALGRIGVEAARRAKHAPGTIYVSSDAASTLGSLDLTATRHEVIGEFEAVEDLRISIEEFLGTPVSLDPAADADPIDSFLADPTGASR